MRGFVYCNRSFDVAPVFALTVQDAADVLDVIAGYDPLDPLSVDDPGSQPYVVSAGGTTIDDAATQPPVSGMIVAANSPLQSGQDLNGKTIAVSITRLGSDPVAVSLTKGATVEEALAKANIATPDNAEFFVGGVRADGDDEVEDGDNISVVTPKQAGV